MDNNMDISTRLKTWWQDLPIFTTLVFFTSIILFFCSFYPHYNQIALILYFPSLYSHFTPLPFFTYPVNHISLLSLIFALFCFLQIAHTTERSLGTIRYILFFILNNILAGAVFFLILLALYSFQIPIMQIWMFTAYSDGLWSIWMIEEVIDCNKIPNELTQYCCIPISFKRKYLPFVFLLAFMVMSRTLLFWDLFAGMIIGYLRNDYFRCV
jgi:hypothetical protein